MPALNFGCRECGPGLDGSANPNVKDCYHEDQEQVEDLDRSMDDRPGGPPQQQVAQASPTRRGAR
jgi:hypothetical protein